MFEPVYMAALRASLNLTLTAGSAPVSTRRWRPRRCLPHLRPSPRAHKALRARIAQLRFQAQAGTEARHDGRQQLPADARATVRRVHIQVVQEIVGASPVYAAAKPVTMPPRSATRIASPCVVAVKVALPATGPKASRPARARMAVQNSLSALAKGRIRHMAGALSIRYRRRFSTLSIAWVFSSTWTVPSCNQ